MKRSLILFFWLVTTAVLFAQPKRVDSLLRVIDKATDTREKTNLLHKLVSVTWDFDFGKAHDFARQEYDLAKKLSDPESETIALTDLGMYHYFVGEYKEARQYYQRALKAAGNKNFGEYPAYTFTRVGNLFRLQGEFDSAKVYYNKTEELLKNSTPGIAMSSLYFHSGWMYNELSEFKKALSYLYRAQIIRYRIGDSLLIAECWRVMAVSHLGANQLDSSRYYLDKVHRIANNYGDNELIILTSINFGDLYAARGQTIEAIRSYDVALELLAKRDFKSDRALVLFHVGKLFDKRGDYIKAIEYYLQSLKINEQLNNKQEIGQIYGWIGWAHTNLHNYVNGKEYAHRSLQLMKSIKDKAGEAFAHNLLGQIAYATGKIQTTLFHYDTALQYRKSLNLEIETANTLFNIAKMYEVQKRYDEALKYFLDDLAFSKSISNLRIQAATSNSIGLIYSYKKDFKNAEKYLEESRQLLQTNGLPIDRRDNFLSFARMYSLSGRSATATSYYEKYIQLNDSVVNRENSLAALQRDALYQLDKKEKQIESLNNENELKAAQINVQKSRIRFQNVLLVFVLLGIALLTIIIYVLFTYYKSKSTANRELSKLNKEIHEQKEEIQAQSEELTEASQTIQEINKGLEKAVEERTGQLKQAYQELDTFIYRSSHDFRRPLTTFMGLAEVAKISVKDVSAIELFQKVNETAINLDRMLIKLQSVSQMGSSELICREVFLNNELDFVLDHYRSGILRRKIRVEREVNLGKPFVSYPLVVRVILENLIENSIEFSSAISPFIKISARETPAEIEIIIEDNGEGIAEEFHNRIFDMYFRASERSKGNGLGLYLVKKALDKLNGRIEFNSSSGQGLVIRIFLPYSLKQM